MSKSLYLEIPTSRIGKSMIRKEMEIGRLIRIEAQTDDDTISFYRKCEELLKKVMVNG